MLATIGYVLHHVTFFGGQPICVITVQVLLIIALGHGAQSGTDIIEYELTVLVNDVRELLFQTFLSASDLGRHLFFPGIFLQFE